MGEVMETTNQPADLAAQFTKEARWVLVPFTTTETFTFRARGRSMAPRIKRGQLCTVDPVDPMTLVPGDIIYARVRKVAGFYEVAANDLSRRELRIINGRGRFVGGWRDYFYVIGKLRTNS